MRKTIFELYYRYRDTLGRHTFQIGYFSEKQKALDAIESLKGKPGFIQAPNGFRIRKERVSFHKGAADCNPVLYELSFETSNADGTDSFILFGVYASRSEAADRQATLTRKKRFSRHADGFSIAEFRLNCVGWADGFSSW